jgi:hypothetical protein
MDCVRYGLSLSILWRPPAVAGRPSRWEVWGGVRQVEGREGGELIRLHVGVIGVGVDLGEEEMGMGAE